MESTLTPAMLSLYMPHPLIQGHWKSPELKIMNIKSSEELPRAKK
jgi:hypothetical protein